MSASSASLAARASLTVAAARATAASRGPSASPALGGRMSTSTSIAAATRVRPSGPSPAPPQLSAAPARRVSVMAVAPSPSGSSGASTATKGKALVSVSDKTDLATLARGLVDMGFEVVSTGGSASSIEMAGVPVTRVDEVTGYPEMLDGRVKTLHPGVHAGILAMRDKEDHMAALDTHGIGEINVVVVNLYPFRATVTAEEPPAFADGVEKIDIGGPTMIRAAAKNHKHVLVVVDPADYPKVLQALSGETSEEEVAEMRRHMAWKAFQHCASYDAQVAEWMWAQVGGGDPAPERCVPMQLVQGLRYGENPHQPAAFYTDYSLGEVGMGGVARAVQHHGKEMSYNNYLDTDAAYNAVADFDEPACVIVKHTNPCGAAVKEDLLESYRLAVIADPISAFGGIVAFNREVDEDLAKEIREYRSPTDGETRMFYEIVVAPSYSEKGLEVLKGKSKNLRILEAPLRVKGGSSLRQVGGGWLAQKTDSETADTVTFTCVSEKQPTEQNLADMRVAWNVVKHVKSNAISIAKDGKLLGMGSGQPNRVSSVEIAMGKAETQGGAKGAALASDAFFPFSWGDSVEKACQAGIAVIAHPGGSMRDQDAIDCCNKYGVVLLTTGVRHFRH